MWTADTTSSTGRSATGASAWACRVQRGRSAPGALQRHVLQVVAHQLADARRAIDMRDDLEQEVRRLSEASTGVMVERAVLVAHGGGGDAHRPVVQRADQRVGLDAQRRVGELLGKAPDLAPAGDRRMVVEVHGMDVAAAASP